MIEYSILNDQIKTSIWMFGCNNPDLTVITFLTPLAIALIHKQKDR